MIISICENTKTSQFDVIKWFSGVKEIHEIKTIFSSLSIIIDNRGAQTIPIHVDGFIFNGNKFFLYELLHKINSLNIKKSLIKELESFFNAVLFIENKSTFYGNYTHKHSDNKIIDLIIAKKCGLKVPETLVSGDKKELALFFDKCSCNVITKSLGGSIRFETKKEILWGKGTSIITNKDIIEASEFFSPSLFQKKIEKEYEIRSFLFKKKFYSMAIFSQNDNKTSVDFRNYNLKKPNRVVPYKLPSYIENKLLKFAKSADLDTGSFDLIVTKKEKEYVFLEVNPYGQFGWLSKNCNYYLEKLIAEYFEN